MKQNEKSLLIDKYVTGKLEDTELWEFKTELERDEDLAKEVKLRQDLYNTLRNEKKIAFFKNINNLRDKNTTRRVKLNVFSRQLQAIAAAAIVLIVIGAGLFTGLLNNNNTNMKLYSEYFIEEGNLLATRTVTDITRSEVKLGIEYYDNNEYEKALNIFRQMPDNFIARLYSGFSYMKTNEYSKAEDQFSYILDHGDNIFVDQAEWNLGLVCLAQNKTDEAVDIFKKISGSNSAYHDEAENLLNELANK